jgi:integrase
VYYDAERDRWVAEITVEAGTRKKYRFKTKQEAIRKKSEALRELEQGVLASGPQRKLGEYLEDWIENVHKGKLKISAYVKYKKLIKYVAADRLGNVWLQKLTPELVQRFYHRLGERKLSSKTINSVHGVLHIALDHAVRWGYVSRNVCDFVTLPRIVTKEAVFLTVEQAHILLESVREHRLEELLMLIVVTGMRRGEVLALRWSDVDFKRQVLHVLHTVDYIPKYGYVEGEPKTKAGKRKINLPLFVVEMLQAYKQEQDELKAKVGEKWEGLGLVFPDLKGGYFNPNYLLRVFKKVLQDAGLAHMRIHDLRHSAATILLAKGVNVKVVSELLGHSDIVITFRTYGHLLPTMQGDVVDKWEEEFGEDV